MTMANTPAQVALDEKGLAIFTDYFVRNYPGPNTIIYDPRWHAPRIYRRAIHAYLSSLSGKAGDDGQGALVERLRSPLAISGEHRAEAADSIEALTRENAALRADKGRLERERGRYRGGLQVLATTFYKGDEHQDYAKHVLGNDAAERRLAEQGHAQSEAVGEAVACMGGTQAFFDEDKVPAGTKLYATLPEPDWKYALAALEEASKFVTLAAPVSQEPVAWRWRDTIDPAFWHVGQVHEAPSYAEKFPLYASPQPLTEGKPSEAEVERARKAADDAYWKWRGLGERKEGEGLDGMHFIVRAALHAAKSKGGQADG